MSYDGSVAGTTSYITQMATMAVVAENDTAFLTILPQMIAYAELRMYRDLDFLFTSASTTAYSLTAGSRNLSVAAETFPYGTLVVPEQINVVTEQSTSTAIFSGYIMNTTLTITYLYEGSIVPGMVFSTDPTYNQADPGTTIVSGSGSSWVVNLGQYQEAGIFSTSIDVIVDRSPLLPTTKEFLDAVYSSSSVANRGLPQYWVPFDDYTFLVGPYPDQSYPVEIVGTYRPASLSATNLTTFISLNLPDIMIMASMVYISAYQRNFGRMNDDPQMAISYESQYQALLKGAMVEEARKKFEAAGWSSQSPSPLATPTRG
jgi:hypothetical protein